jgi:ferredoxin
MQRDVIADAAGLDTHLRIAEALCRAYRDLFDGGEPDVNWGRARKMRADPASLVAAAEAASSSCPVMQIVVWDLRLDRRGTLALLHRALRVFEAWDAGELIGVYGAGEAERRCGMRDAAMNPIGGWW